MPGCAAMTICMLFTPGLPEEASLRVPRGGEAFQDRTPGSPRALRALAMTSYNNSEIEGRSGMAITPLRRDQVERNIPPAEWAARVDLAAAYRYAQYAGWNDLIFNHITLRVPGEPDHFFIKPHELLFEEVT